MPSVRKIPLALLLTLLVAGVAFALAESLDAPDAGSDAAPDAATARPAPGITLDYTLYGLSEGGEIVLETTRHADAVEANRTGPYALRDESRYAPRTFELAALESPQSVAEFVLARLDLGALAPGDEIDIVVEDPVAPEDELVRGEVPRRSGPFPARYSLTTAEFEATVGRPPVVGDEVNTTATFSAFVERVQGGVVDMRVNVKDGGAIVSRPLASVFRVETSEDGGEFWMVLHPVKDTQFRLPVENRVLGLAPGNYLWTGLTEETASYVAHPTVSPIYVGADFRIRATVIENE